MVDAAVDAACAAVTGSQLWFVDAACAAVTGSPPETVDAACAAVDATYAAVGESPESFEEYI